MVMIVGGDPGAAYARAARATAAEMAAFLQDLFGQKLTALMVNAKDPKSIGKWSRGEREPQPDVVERLRNVFQVAELLLQVESPQTVRGWFMGMNPQLDDQSPALVIIEQPKEVLRAARAFLAGG